MLKTILISTFILTIGLQALSQNHKLSSGPFAGHTTTNSIKIWMMVKRTTRVHFIMKNKNTEFQKSVNISDCEKFESQYTIITTFNKLEANSKYTLDIYLDNQKLKKSYEFNTLSKDSIKDFSFLIGSCLFLPPKLLNPIYPGNEDGILASMNKTESDFMLWLGDNIYYPLTINKTKTMHRIYTKYRKNKRLQKFMSSRPQFSTWDDHDYGRNNSRSEFELKEHSLHVHKNFWANPYYGEKDNKGVYNHFRYYDAEFIFLDGRFHASREKNKQTLMGKEQLIWFKNRIENSKASYIFVINGIQTLNLNCKYECYERLYKEEYKQLKKIINNKKGTHFMFLTGDRHFSELISDTLLNNDIIYDVTCSPLGAPIRPYYSKSEKDNPQLIEGTIVDEHNYIRVNLKGKNDLRKIIIEAFDNKGKLLWEYDTLSHKFL